MKKRVAFLLVVLLLTFNLCGCGIDYKASERFYLWRKPSIAIEHFFKLELPKDTEIQEYEYEYARLLDNDDNIFNNNTSIFAKLSFPAEEWDAFAVQMDAAEYQSLEADTDEARDESEFYNYFITRYPELFPSWWEFDHTKADGYYGWYVSGYVKHVSTPYLFSIPNGDFVTVYLYLCI